MVLGITTQAGHPIAQPTASASPQRGSRGRSASRFLLINTKSSNSRKNRHERHVVFTDTRAIALSVQDVRRFAVRQPGGFHAATWADQTTVGQQGPTEAGRWWCKR